MKRMFIGLIAATALPALAMAQAPDKNHPPAKAMDQATPEMKNPGGADKLQPAQKAMDEATPTEKKSDASSGASSGETGTSKTWNSNDAKSGGSGETKSK